MQTEVIAKVRLVRSQLAKKGLEGVMINDQANLAWLTGGRFFVNLASVAGVGTLWIGPEKVELIANNVEGQRLWQEESAHDVCDDWVTYPWYDEGKRAQLMVERIKGLHTATDLDLAEEFLNLRLKLTPVEQERFLSFGRSVGEAVESAARDFLPGESEYQVAARLAQASLERGMEPLVCLVGGDDRARLHRHPLPTEQTIAKYAILVLSARKWGLVASATRSVYFGQIPQELAAKQRAVNEVDASFMVASRPGTSLGEVFKAGQAAYARQGFAEEWQLHHQGGLTGYQSREVKATPQTKRLIEVGHVLAWNPTLQGTKAEDTVLVRANGLQNLTATGNFPTETVEIAGQSFLRPVILER
ncbi:MAG: M24 family metallopeptidase [Desulfitobacteriaceae bacterium]